MWIGNYSTGVDFLPSKQSPFTTLTDKGSKIQKVYGVFMDSKENLWLGAENDLLLYKNGRIEHTWNFSNKLSISSSVVYVMEEDREGYIWMGLSDDGVLRFNPATGSFEHVATCADKLDIHALHCDSKGKMWIGSEDGLFSYENGTCRKEEEISKKMDRNIIVFAICEDMQQQMWIGTMGSGIFVFDKDKQLVAHLKDSCCRSVCQIIADEDGGIWIASYDGLVYVQDVNRLEDIVLYDERHGIKDSHLCALQQDMSGDIWVSSFSGIAHFDRSKARFYNYGYQNGIPVGNYVESATAIGHDGAIFFGSPSGICNFYPQLLNDAGEVSAVQIIGCEGIYSPSEGKQTSIISPDADGIIHLKYNENTFKVAFTLENFAQENNVEYSYMMKGLDKRWFETEGDNEVTFRNLSPGEYTFVIRAKLKNQDWEDAVEDQLAIVVSPPFWLTWWAKLFYGLIIICLLVYYFHSYKRKLKLESSLLLAQRENLQKEELHEERLRFFTNVTHELRTPLTLIVGPLQDLFDDKRLPEVYHRKIEMINKSADRLQNLINDILEFRKTETQNRKLCVAKGDLKALVKDTGKYFKDLNRNPKLSVYILVNPIVPDVYFDSEVITTVLNNLLSNAMKYTPEGKINLLLNTNGDRTEITVSDTGYGIAKDALPHIFDRYYQAKGKHQASGTGIGLALVKSLAELHEADLKVESKLGEGSKFTFSILTDNTYPNALHKMDEQTEDIQQQSAVTLDRLEAEVATTENEEDNRPLLLVVEDNEQIRQYIADSMGEDYRVIQAENGLKGISAACEQIPDIIVSDIMMPEMDGIEMTKTLKEDIRTSHIPIILLTAKDSLDDKEEGYDSGADSYLTKPFTAKLLNSRIQNLLNSRRRFAELMILRNMSGSNQEITELADEHSLQDTEPVMSKLDQEFMSKLNGLILDNLLKVDIDMAFLTDKMAMSHSTFYRKVKALTGMTAMEYIRKMKLKRSMVLLQSGEYNVTEAAMMAGFNNQGHFRDSFKKEFGMNPSDVLKK